MHILNINFNISSCLFKYTLQNNCTCSNLIKILAISMHISNYHFFYALIKCLLITLTIRVRYATVHIRFNALCKIYMKGVSKHRDFIFMLTNMHIQNPHTNLCKKWGQDVLKEKNLHSRCRICESLILSHGFNKCTTVAVLICLVSGNNIKWKAGW